MRLQPGAVDVLDVLDAQVAAGDLEFEVSASSFATSGRCSASHSTAQVGNRRRSAGVRRCARCCSCRACRRCRPSMAARSAASGCRCRCRSATRSSAASAGRVVRGACDARDGSRSAGPLPRWSERGIGAQRKQLHSGPIEDVRVTTLTWRAHWPGAGYIRCAHTIRNRRGASADWCACPSAAGSRPGVVAHPEHQHLAESPADTRTRSPRGCCCAARSLPRS